MTTSSHPPRAAGALMLLVLALWLLSPGLVPQAQAAPQAEPFDLSWEIYRQDDSPSAELLAVLWLTPHEGYHAYANPPGETGLPTVLSLSIAAQTALLPVAYPEGQAEPDIFDPDKLAFTYHEATPLFIPLGRQSLPLTLEGTLSLLACSDASCRPIKKAVTTTFPGPYDKLPDARNMVWYPLLLATAVSDTAAQGTFQVAAKSTGESDSSPIVWNFTPKAFLPDLEVQSIFLALVLAFVGGLILNFMPCVLPVVSLKLSALLSGSEKTNPQQRKAAFREHNLFFSLGVILYFLFLGLLLSSLGLAWGQLFQKPQVVLGLIAVVFVLALSLFDVWTLPVIDLKAGSKAKSPKVQALFTGILATLLATPCSGPFLGGVLAWVLLQPTDTIMAVFLSLGLGMASPFVLLSARPGLIRFFPKPGAWTGTLEKAVGFFLLATCLYLLTILPQAQRLGALALLWLLAVAAWLWGRWAGLEKPTLQRWAVRFVAVALVATGWFALFSPTTRDFQWQSFEPRTFQAMLGTRPIVADFTADWCPNCKLLEHTTLSDDNVARWQKKYDLTLVRVDMTREDPQTLALLRALGSQSIPVVAIFPPGQGALSPMVLRDIFTPSQMDEALQTTLAP